MKNKPSDQKQILIVDDEASSRVLLSRLLTDAGYDCIESNTALGALELVREGRPSLVLIDLSMPGLDGAELLKRLRGDPDAEIARTPAIMITGHAGSEVLCLEAGAA